VRLNRGARRLGVAAVSFVALLIGVDWYWSLPDRRERRGNFEITYKTNHAFGHRSTTKALYYHRGNHRSQVAGATGQLAFAPADPDRLVYENCDREVKAANAPPNWLYCVQMYYDGHMGRNHVIGALRVSLSPLNTDNPESKDISSPWSPSGGHVVIKDDYELVLVDLNSGKATRFTETLGLQSPHYPDRWQHRVLRFGGWSPDATHVALIVNSPRGPQLPALDWHQEVYSLEASSGTLLLVGTHDGNLARGDEQGLVHASQLAWNGGELQPPR
jgi:hypothetical protein